MPASKKITGKPDEIAAFLDRFDVSSVILLRRSQADSGTDRSSSSTATACYGAVTSCYRK
jgi:hypothetical protein